MLAGPLVKKKRLLWPKLDDSLISDFFFSFPFWKWRCMCWRVCEYKHINVKDDLVSWSVVRSRQIKSQPGIATRTRTHRRSLVPHICKPVFCWTPDPFPLQLLLINAWAILVNNRQGSFRSNRIKDEKRSTNVSKITSQDLLSNVKIDKNIDIPHIASHYTSPVGFFFVYFVFATVKHSQKYPKILCCQ